MRIVSLLALALLLTGCCGDNLYVQTKYLSHKDLASYYIGTPDPLKECPDIGQRVMVCWSLPKCAMECDEVVLRVFLRYGNQEEKVITKELDCPSGYLLYDLINDEYCEKNGILSYLAEILADGEVIECWTHQIWTDRIEFEEEV